jgi:hypothetical protein
MPARLLPLVRNSQRRIEALLAHAARLAALALRELVTAGRAPKFNSGSRVTLSVGIEGDGFRPAPDALLAELFPALHTHTGHERPRIGTRN